MRYSEFRIVEGYNEVAQKFVQSSSAEEVNASIKNVKEDVGIGAVKKVPPLSDDAKRALNSWEWSNWIDGDLSKAFESNSEIAQEINAAFEPVRNVLRKKHGKTIKLYRGKSKSELAASPSRPDRMLFSWTMDKRVAAQFAGKQKLSPGADITDAQINAALQTYERTGFVSFGKYKYKRNKKHPEYYDIYRGKEYQTDGDNLRRELERQREDAINWNKGKNDNVIIDAKQIPIEDIIWITNSAVSK
jgi:hypothetical protein